jgi:hypothetical protein
MAWVQANWVAIGGVVLLIVRVVESIMQMTGKDNPTLFGNIIQFLQIFFKLS